MPLIPAPMTITSPTFFLAGIAMCFLGRSILVLSQLEVLLSCLDHVLNNLGNVFDFDDSILIQTKLAILEIEDAIWTESREYSGAYRQSLL